MSYFSSSACGGGEDGSGGSGGDGGSGSGGGGGGCGGDEGVVVKQMNPVTTFVLILRSNAPEWKALKKHGTRWSIWRPCCKLQLLQPKSTIFN